MAIVKPKSMEINLLKAITSAISDLFNQTLGIKIKLLSPITVEPKQAKVTADNFINYHANSALWSSSQKNVHCCGKFFKG